MPAVLSKPVAGGLPAWLSTHPAAKPTVLSLLLLLIFARKRLTALVPNAVGQTAPRPREGGSLDDSAMDHALEQVYLPSSDPARDDSYDLLVPHRGRISKVKVRPTKTSTFNTHYADFKKLPPVATATKASKKKAEKDMSEADQQEARRQEHQAVRAEGGAAAASAKKVGVNAEFLRQLK